MINPAFTVFELAGEPMPWPCSRGHTWHPTIIIGYFQCAGCLALAACRICAPRLRGKPLVGVCQQHQHLHAHQTGEEVLS